MSNDSQIVSGSGDKIRDYDDGTRKWPVGFIAFGPVSDPGPIAAPTVVSSSNPFPVTINSGAVNDTIVGPFGQAVMASSVPVVVASNQSAIPVSGTISATIASPLGQAIMASSVPVVVASNQSAITISGTVTSNVGTGTGTVNVAQVGGAAYALGQATMANSAPVVVASNQSAIPISGTITANAGTGTLAVSLANHQSVNVDQIGGASFALGQTTMANSAPVVIASNQSAVPVSGTITANAGTGTLNVQSVDSTKATYIGTTTNFPLAVSPTDVFTLTGSGTKTVKVWRLYIQVQSGTTTNGIAATVVAKRSTANTGGSPITVSQVTADSNDAAPTAVAKFYETNATTLGTLVGTYFQVQYPIIANSPTAGNPATGLNLLPFDFLGTNFKPIVLRGTSEILVVSLSASSLPAGCTACVSVIWTEE